METSSRSPPMAFLPSLSRSMESSQNYSPGNSLRRASSLPRSGFARGNQRPRPPIPDSFALLGPQSRRIQSDPPNPPQAAGTGMYAQHRLTSPDRVGVAGRSLSTGMLESSRDVLEQQVNLYEHEIELYRRAKELWNMERAELLKRIEELELALESNRGSTVPSEMVSPRTYPTMVGQMGGNAQKPLPSSSNRPSASTSSGDGSAEERFWEGAGASSRQGSVTTRSFSNTAKMEEGRLPSISETEGNRSGQASVPTATIPTSTASAPEDSSKIINTGIDISLVEKGLDGISLKPSALPPSVIAKVLSPPSSTESPRSPSPSRVTSESDTVQPSAAFLSPHSPHLIKDAGHTPLAKNYDLDGALSGEITPIGVPKQEVATQVDPSSLDLQPSGLSEPLQDLEDDPELSGPLHLENHSEKDQVFLNQLDAKLLHEAAKIVRSPSISETSEIDNGVGPGPEHEENEPKLKFKRSMNFGSAFGSRPPFG